MKRREFITLLGGAAASWPVGASAQQPDRMRHIGVLGGFAENDPEMKSRLAGFQQGLGRLGWIEGRNVRIDYRFAPAGSGQAQAKELVALQPDVVFAHSTPVVAAMKRESRIIPIVFVSVSWKEALAMSTLPGDVRSGSTSMVGVAVARKPKTISANGSIP